MSQLVKLPLNQTLAAITVRVSVWNIWTLSAWWGIRAATNAGLDWDLSFDLATSEHWPCHPWTVSVQRLLYAWGRGLHSHSSLQAFLACCWDASSDRDDVTILHVELVCLQCSFLSVFPPLFNGFLLIFQTIYTKLHMTWKMMNQREGIYHCLLDQ